jgi:DNA-binding XRE family transcriptional regulator
MKIHTNHQVVKGADGSPLFVLVPYDQYLDMLDDGDWLPHEVVSITVDKQCGLVRAWREHLGITQTEMAKRLGMTQAGYHKIEKSKSLKRDTLKSVAKALGVKVTQLDDDD